MKQQVNYPEEFMISKFVDPEVSTKWDSLICITTHKCIILYSIYNRTMIYKIPCVCKIYMVSLSLYS